MPYIMSGHRNIADMPPACIRKDISGNAVQPPAASVCPDKSRIIPFLCILQGRPGTSDSSLGRY